MATNPENLASPEVKQLDKFPANKKLQNLYQRLRSISWQGWAVILILVFGSVGFTATSMLLKLPTAPQCSRIFWPIASASLRLYCAQLSAEQRTVESLLRAIDLVAALPEDHPLRQEIDRSVEDWAVEILALSEKDFQAGKLEEAIATARKIPAQLQAYKLVEEKIQKWRSIWQEGAAIFSSVEEQLRQSNWNQAFREAVQLLYVNNEYWATTKYDEITKKIQLAKEESNKLDNAYAILRRGGLDNWLNAIAEAQKIPQNSYAYQEAQNIITKAKEKLLGYVDELVENQNWQNLLDLCDRIPENLSLSAEISDWSALANAGLTAQQGTVESLDSAIAVAEQIDSSRPFYEDAQNLISRWRLEKDDLNHLTQARAFVKTGTINDLKTAIAQAELVPQGNPRYEEARREINSWTKQIQTIEDRPTLNKARDLAYSGTINSLQEAIAQASLISSNRALYGEAQQAINQWRTSIERQEDQPFLDQAIALANAKDYNAAIATAGQIRRGRVLSGEARKNMRRWQQELQAQRSLQEAYALAQTKTPEALAAAINRLQTIPRGTDVNTESLQAISSWSYQLLAMAQEQANVSGFEEAIRLALLIPAGSPAYNAAREQIATWQEILQPPVPPQPPPVTPEVSPEEPVN